MSIPLVPDADDTPAMQLVARAVVPVIIAAAVMALAVVAVGAQPPIAEEREAKPASTPYSEMHAGIPNPAETEEQPPTF